MPIAPHRTRRIVANLGGISPWILLNLEGYDTDKFIIYCNRKVCLSNLAHHLGKPCIGIVARVGMWKTVYQIYLHGTVVPLFHKRRCVGYFK